jgi:type I restriction enzyme S subunit
MATDAWRQVTLGEIAASEYGLVDGPFGSNLPASEYVPSGVPVIRGSNLSLGLRRFNDDSFVYVSEEFAQRLARSLCHPGDIVFTKKGTLGQTGIIPVSSKFDEFLLSSNQMKLSVDPSKADPLFVFYFVSSPTSRGKIIQDSTVTGVPKTNLAYLRDFPILLPPIKEQTAIAGTVGSLDDMIELNRKMNETLEAMARALFKSWFVDFDPVRAKAEGRDPGLPAHIAALFPGSFEDSELGEVPTDWKIISLGDFAEVIDCLHSRKPERVEEGLPLLQLGNIRADALLDMTDTYLITSEDYTKWISRMEASPGNCVVTNVGRVGAVAQIPSDFKAALGRNMTGIRCRTAYPFPTYLIQALTSSSMSEEIVRKTDSGTILDSLNVRNIPRLRIIVPPIQILALFERQCRPIRARMEANLKETSSLAALRDTLLPKLISGGMHVPAATLESTI